MGNVIIDIERGLPRLSSVVTSKSLPISSTVSKEMQFWKGRRETSSGAYSQLKKYWDNISFAGWTPQGTAWSAAFVSYILKDFKFPGNSLHYQYTKDAAYGKNRGKWRAISIPKNRGKIKISIGDVLVRPRAGKYSNSHGDVVFHISNGVAYAVGGNMSDTVKTEKVSVDKDGILQNSKNYLIVLKKNPKTKKGSFLKFFGLGIFGFGVFSIAKRLR